MIAMSSSTNQKTEGKKLLLKEQKEMNENCVVLMSHRKCLKLIYDE